MACISRRPISSPGPATEPGCTATTAADDRHNVPGEPVLPPLRGYEQFDREQLAGGAFTLDAGARQVVDETIRAHCLIRDWSLLALNVRTNHVHLIVTCGDVAPETVMGQLKAWCSRRLREAGLVGSGRKVWTRHGSTVYLWTPDDIAAAHRYVTEGHGPDI